MQSRTQINRRWARECCSLSKGFVSNIVCLTAFETASSLKGQSSEDKNKKDYCKPRQTIELDQRRKKWVDKHFVK